MDAQKINVVGGGLVGPLMAVYLAQKGFKVALHERRPDMRSSSIPAGRSINLAVTARGLKALGEVGLRDKVMEIAIPMKGRMIHDTSGNTSLQLYGQKDEEVIYAVSRRLLNIVLLDAADACGNIDIVFNRRCTAYDIAGSTLDFMDERTGQRMKIKSDVTIAADGAWSAVRRSMFETAKNFNYSQNFLEYGYKELVIPQDASGGFRMEKNALHIWPRKSYMMIALPNTDGSFTVTLFYPYEGKESFASLTSEKGLLDFFRASFPDALPMMPELAGDFFANQTGALMTVKCSPWHSGGNAVLLGDAAHAIVPFFAQGMNSGFEDCSLLNSLIEGACPSWREIFEKFSALRKPDTDAIADMAVENFIEMRDSVTSPEFLLKKQVGFELEKRYPGKFIPRYSMVIFHPEIPYAEARRRSEAQDRILAELCLNISSPEQVNWDKAGHLIGALGN